MTQPFSSAAEMTVTCELVVHVIVAGDPQVSLPAGLHYQRSDPYAVRLSIGATSGGTVDWVFALSLLREGMSRPVGAGAVMVSPQYAPHHPMVRITVRSRAEAAVLDVAASAVEGFLQQAHSLVPSGTESRYVDIDRTVALLLNAGG